MKFVAYENIERPIILFLRSEGNDVFSVAESCVGITDEEILKQYLSKELLYTDTRMKK